MNLEDLPIYGNFLKLYNLALPPQTTITEAGSLYGDLQNLDKAMFIMYSSFILTRAGFYNNDLYDGDPMLNTLKWNVKDWVYWYELFIGAYEPVYLKNEWIVNYRNEKNEVLKLKLITEFIAHLKFEDGKLKGSLAEGLVEEYNKSDFNYVLVHPLLRRRDKKTFREVKKQTKELTDQDFLFSADEFAFRFIPDKQKRFLAEENWVSIREGIIKDLQKRYPIIIRATHDKQIKDAGKSLRKARLRHEERDFKDAIRDAGYACEGLLRVWYYIHKLEEPEERMGLGDLLSPLKTVILEEFGKGIYNDIDFIRYWRNKVIHPPLVKPDEASTLIVVKKAELFYELFNKKVLAPMFARVRRAQ